MMRFLKSKVLWLIVYAIAITGVFLYFLFPAALFKPQLEAAVSSPDYALKTETFHLSLPMGIKLKDPQVHSLKEPADVVFQGEWLDLQFIPWSFFQKYRHIRFKGEAYSGKFNGRAGFMPYARAYPLVEGQVNFQGIDLSGYGTSRFPLLKGLTGKARGSLLYAAAEATDSHPSGKLSLYLSRGAYPLPEPFLGVNRIEFDRGEVQAQLKNGNVMIEKLEIYGTQMNCFLSGEVQLANPAQSSQLNLKGTLEIAGKNKVKMNITVGGTLANPLFRYM